MGKDRTTTSTSQQTKVETTPEEKRWLASQARIQEATEPGMIGAQTQGLNLINQLLTGQEPLPGFFQNLSQGINPQVTNEIVQQAIRDITPGFQSSGILDSGVAASIAARTAGDIRRATEEFNLGNKFNLLNLALSGQAQVQQPILANAQMLGSQLAGLRTINQTGRTVQTSMSPFFRSFQESLGKGIGTALTAF